MPVVEKIAIVGGGIGGLFAANALVRKGFDVAVYERASDIGEIGAGVFVTPNAVRHLERVGLGEAVERSGGRVGDKSRYFRDDGAEIAGVQTSDSSGRTPAYGMHRADLARMLYENLDAAIVHTGCECVGFEQDDREARVRFADGRSVAADLVVAADGIHSTLQPSVLAPPEPVFSGTVTYRGLVDRDRVHDWPRDAWFMWLGRGRHFLVFPVRAGEMLNYVGFVPADEEWRESWSASGDPDRLRADFAGWDPRIERLLAEVDHTFRWGLWDREPLERWVRGRLVLLGDAAHPMLPHLGQGANQAIEDGMALAAILAAEETSLESALARYQDVRLDRVAEVQRGARQNGLRYDSQSEYADLEQRDREMRNHVEFRRWIYDYDVVGSSLRR